MGLTKLINLNPSQVQNKILMKSKPKLTNLETCKQKHKIN